MNKGFVYQQLINKRKLCQECYLQTGQMNLHNGSSLSFHEGIHDTNALGQWSAWHGDLNADFMVIGQNWGDLDYYIQFRNQNVGEFERDNKTNINLRTLFQCIDPKIDIFDSVTSVKLFFTNSLLCYKEGKMAQPTRAAQHRICSKLYLQELIKIIEPRIIITLGEKAFSGLWKLNFKKGSNITFDKYIDLVEHGELQLCVNNSTVSVFPVVHPGPLGIRNRNFALQKEDWYKIGQKARALSIV